MLLRRTNKQAMKLYYLGLIFITSFLVSCVGGSFEEKLSVNTCYFSLDFSDLPSSESENLTEISMNLHDNYFIYKKMEFIPLRFDNKIFLSLDCARKTQSLELDEWMRDFIEEFSELNQISNEEYDSMFERATSGVIVIQ